MSAPALCLRLRIAIAAMIGLSGLAVMIAIAGEGGQRLPDPVPAGVAAFLCAALAGALTAPRFGQPGRRGAMQAALGALLATTGAAALGGALLALASNPLAGLVGGPALVFGMIIASTPVALTWGVALGLAHLAALLARRRLNRGSSGCP